MAIINQGDGSDRIFGTSERDLVRAGGGDDTIFTGCYADLIIGGAGADTLNGGHGADELYDGSFNDDTGFHTPDSDADILNGGFARDTLYGGQRDILNGGEGFDEAVLSLTTFGDTYLDFRGLNAPGGTANFSVVTGQVGSLTAIEIMTVFTGAGADTVIAADIDTDIFAGAGADILIGGAGFDELDLGDGADYAAGGAGSDTLNALVSGFFAGDDGDVDQLIGGQGFDDLSGSNTDQFDGGADEDAATIVYSLTGNTFVDLRGYNAANTYFLEGGGSIIGVESVAIETQGGADTVLDFDQDGSVSTNGGDDVIVMAGGFDSAIGGDGADFIDGGDDDDTLVSGIAGLGSLFMIDDGDVDRLLGGSGSDTLVLGLGDFGDGGTDADDPDGEVIDTAVLAFGALTASVYLDFTDVAQATFFALPGSGGISGIEAIEISSGSGDDVIIDTNLDGVIDGGAGADSLSGQNGDDELSGGDGADYLNGGADDDSLMGGAGVDELRGGSGDDFLFASDDGAGGMDIVVGEDGDDDAFINYTDFADGGAGEDSVLISFSDLGRAAYFDFSVAAGGAVASLSQFGGTGSIQGFERFGAFGTEFADTFLDADTNGLLSGGDGDDTLVGRGGDDFLLGDDGNDFLDGGAGGDFLLGEKGADTIRGGDGDDFIDGGVFDFPVEDDDDILSGEAGNDNITGGDGFDFIDGGIGNDTLNGDGNNDNVFGGDGDDTVAGGCGDDIMTGGAGRDVFVLVGTTTGEFDTITDYNRADDSLRIEGDEFDDAPILFTGLQEGDFNGDGVMDTRLGYASGELLILGVSGLSLADWNGELVV